MVTVRRLRPFCRRRCPYCDFGVVVAKRPPVSEYRDFVDNDRLPIVQQTRLSETNLAGSVRFALTPRGREVSRLAWIPSTVTPYVGAGGGMLFYRLEQEGDFVDFLDFSIFPGQFESHGWTPSAQVFGGVDVRMWRRLFLSLEARYLWADADLGFDYIGFDPIDLTGFRISSGVSVAF